MDRTDVDRQREAAEGSRTTQRAGISRRAAIGGAMGEALALFALPGLAAA